MYTEVMSVGLVLLVCWVVLTVLDLAVAGLLALLCGLSFKHCFLRNFLIIKLKNK